MRQYIAGKLNGTEVCNCRKVKLLLKKITDTHHLNALGKILFRKKATQLIKCKLALLGHFNAHNDSNCTPDVLTMH